MKRFILSLMAALVLDLANAQTVVLQNTFTFSAGAPCSVITSWDSVPNAYPYEMGDVCLYQGDPLGGVGSGIAVPWQLGYLNSGALFGCNPIIWGPKAFTIGNGTHTGDTFTLSGSTTCPYYTGEYGGASNNLLAGFSVVASYVVMQFTSCGHGHCIHYLRNILQGGTGTVEETQN